MEENNKNDSNQFYPEETVGKIDDSFIRVNERQLYKAVITKIEKALIERILERTYGNQLRTAKILGLNRNTLHAKIRKLGINVRRWKN